MHFIESGDIYEKYSGAKGRHIVINLMAKYVPNKTGEIFITRIKSASAYEEYSFTLSID